MAHPTVVLNVVGLSEAVIGTHTPALQRLARRGRVVQLEPPLPAVTTTVQSSMVTGLAPGEHGIVGNGWYHRDLAEVRFWHRSNHLVQGEKLWETARRRDTNVTTANLFWWYNNYSSCDLTLNVRPIYKADGRKISDCYTKPAELREDLQRELGRFPLQHFWGPFASVRSTHWIADAAIMVQQRYHPTLMLLYLPHLDYALQKFGPGSAEAHQAAVELDSELARLVDFFDQAQLRTMIVSEYGIEPVERAIAPNRALRAANLLAIRTEQGLELLDPGACEAFAVADHQVAHVYVREPAMVEHVAELCRGIEGVERVLNREAQHEAGLGHERAGELVLVARSGWWFTYDYWEDEARAPDFARTVDIHRKPGYDPRELFIDPGWRWPRLSLGQRLVRSRYLNMRALMDFVPLDTALVRGSHGRVDVAEPYRPVMILPAAIGDWTDASQLPATAVRDAALASLFEG